VAPLRYLSPAMLVQSAFAEMAGTGAIRRHAFEDQAAPLGEDDYGRMPAFMFAGESVSAIARGVVMPLIALVVAAAGLLWAALRRYEAIIAE
jgi:hypothetical protein